MNAELLRNAVNKYREDNHISDFDVALDIGISQDTIRRFRQGDAVMPKTLQKIEKFFTVEPVTKEEQYRKFLEWMLTQQYYILPAGLKNKIMEVVNH